MNNRPQPHTIYRHFKGNLYQINCIATDSETGEEMVVYQALYGDYRFYVRPLEMFMSEVDKNKYPEASQKYRFERVEVKNTTASAQGPTHLPKLEPVQEIVQETVAVGENKIDPDVMDFLDADTYERRLEILGKIQYKITNSMIDLMSTVVDINVPSGDVQKRYDTFREALNIRRHYECNRLRNN